MGAGASDIPGRLFRLSIGVFFIGGFLSSTVSLFVPRLTLVYGLDYPHALLVQLAFHSSYLLFAIPIGAAIIALGYMRSTVAGLSIMAASCLLFLGAHGLRSYGLVLLSLLSLSAGITFLQIASNTVVTVVGQANGAAFRLNLLQAFNALGTVLGPLVGARYLLGAPAGRGTAAIAAIAPPFLFAIVMLLLLGIAFAISRGLLAGQPGADPRGGRMERRLLRDRRLMSGAGAIFLYVGAEVAIGTLLVNYLVLPATWQASPIDAARMVSFYWGGAMIGRLVGAWLARRVDPALLLLFAAIGATVLVALAIMAQGHAGSSALLAVGLCNSIMYPTIYVLALPTDAKRATPGSTLLCMAVVGGAVIPMLTGLLAQQIGLATALILPASCYVIIAGFAQACRGNRI